MAASTIIYANVIVGNISVLSSEMERDREGKSYGLRKKKRKNYAELEEVEREGPYELRKARPGPDPICKDRQSPEKD